MTKSCLVLSLRPAGPNIARVIASLGMEVHQEDNCVTALDLVAERDWTAVAVESMLPHQNGWDFILALSGLRVFSPKFFLMTEGYHDVPQIDLEAYGITSLLPRPLDNRAKVEAILHAHGVI